MSQLTHGIIMNYRIGIRTQMSKMCLVQFADVNSISEVGKLIGRKMVWTDGKNRHVGMIVGLHGRKGVVKVKFRHGVPGQALGTIVELVS